MARKPREAKEAKPRQSTGGAANLEPYKWKPGQSGNPGGKPAVIRELRDLARAYTQESIDTLAAIMKDKKAPPAARVAAVAHILDRGYGKPTQNINAQVRNAQKMTDDELIAFLTSVDEADGGEGVAEAADDTRITH